MSTAHSITHQQHELSSHHSNNNNNNSIRGSSAGDSETTTVSSPSTSSLSSSAPSTTVGGPQTSSSKETSSTKKHDSKPSIRSSGPNRFRGDAAAFNPSQQPFVPSNMNGGGHLHNSAVGAGAPQYPMYSAQNYMYPHAMPPMPQYYNTYPYMIPVPPPGNMANGAGATPGYDAYYNFYQFNPMAMAVAANGGYPMQPTNIPNGSGGNNYGNRMKSKRNNNNISNHGAVNSNTNNNNALVNSVPVGSKNSSSSDPATPKNTYASTSAAPAHLVNKSSSTLSSTKIPDEQNSIIKSTSDTTVEQNANPKKAESATNVESHKASNDGHESTAQVKQDKTENSASKSLTSGSHTPTIKNATTLASDARDRVSLPLLFNTSKKLAFDSIKSHQSFRDDLKNTKGEKLSQFVSYSRSKSNDKERGFYVYPNTVLKIIDYSNNSTAVTLPNSWAGPLYNPHTNDEKEKKISQPESKEDSKDPASVSETNLDNTASITSPQIAQGNWASFLQSTPAAKKRTVTPKPKASAHPAPSVIAPAHISSSHSNEAGTFDLANESAQPLGILLLRMMFDSHYSIFNTSTPHFDIQPRGLTNTGNICYMNSILQVLLYCEPFNKLIKLISEMSVGSLDKSKSKTPLLDATINLFNQFQAKAPANGNLSNTTTNGYVLKSVSPEQFYTKLITHKKFQHLKWGQQEDAEEFLGYYLDALTEELLASIGELNIMQVDSLIQQYPGDDINEFKHKVKSTMKLVKKEANNAPDSSDNKDDNNSEDDEDENGWSEVGSKKKQVSVRRNGEEEPTPMTEIFGGQFRNVLTIPKSSKHSNYLKSITLDPFRNIQLDLSESNSIEDALIHLNKIEKINYKPLEDKEELIVLKQTFIDKLPQVLTIHLKRFAFGDHSQEDHNGYEYGDNGTGASSHSTAGSSGSFTSVAAATTSATTGATTTAWTTTASTTTASTAPTSISPNGRSSSNSASVSNGHSSNYYGGYGYGSGINKLRKKITYEHELTIPPQIFSPQAHVVEGPRYRLIGVVYHHGSSMESGHYTCDVRVDRGEGKEQWIRIDDTLIESVSASDVLNVDEATRNAYILFYEHI